MADSFKDLMSTDKQSSIELLSKQLSEATTTKRQGQATDERFWKPSADKAGNAKATIRFLPKPKGEDAPFVKLWYHSFKGPSGLWYIENCLTTIGKTDPCVEHNSVLWNEGKQDEARKMKRVLKFISNVLVLKDPAAPENEGKVFLYRYGKTIFDMISAQGNPIEPEDEPCEVFHFVNGKDFRLVRVMEQGWPKYNSVTHGSSFGSVRQLYKDPAKIKAVWDKQHSLQQFLAEDQFKSPSELQAQLNKVLGLSGAGATAVAIEDVPFDLDTTTENGADNLGLVAKAPTAETVDDDTVKFFSDLSSLE